MYIDSDGGEDKVCEICGYHIPTGIPLFAHERIDIDTKALSYQCDHRPNASERDCSKRRYIQDRVAHVIKNKKI